MRDLRVADRRILRGGLSSLPSPHGVTFRVTRGVTLGVTPCSQTVDTGYAKGEHKLLGVQASFMNLPIDMRFDHDVIQLLAIVRHPAVMRWGQAGVFCGVDKKGERIADGPTTM